MVARAWDARGARSALFGTVLSLAYYPSLLVQLSPKQTFLSYRGLARSGEKLAMIGVASGSASYYAGGNIQSFPNANEAFDWLMAGPGRRWLVIRQNDLAVLNAGFRAQSPEHGNLPVLDATSSEVLLASNRLAPGETNQNPLEGVVLSERLRRSIASTRTWRISSMCSAGKFAISTATSSRA